mgnify:CR=1 FL=1
MVQLNFKKSGVIVGWKNLVIDMTEVTGDPDDMDDESEASYEIELEIVNPKEVSDDDTLYNIIYKIECVMKTIS